MLKRKLMRLPRRSLVVCAAAGATLALAVGVAGANGVGLPVNVFGDHTVGTQTDGSVLLPDNQAVAPYGARTKFTADMVGTAVSPDGTKLAVQAGGDATGASSLNILDAGTQKVLQTFGGRNDAAPVYSPDGTALYTGASTASSGGNGTNTVLKYLLGTDGLVTNPTAPITLTLPSNQDFPFGLAVSADGSKLYVALSATNDLGIIDTATMQLVSKVPVGNAPQGVTVVGDKVYVANRGGRPATSQDTTNASHGTPIVSDPKTGAATTGTVSVVDPSVKTPATVPSSPDTSSTPADILDVDFADGTPTDHAQNLPETTLGTPSIAKDDGLGVNVATFNGVDQAYTYPFGDQWSKVADSFSIECKFRWNGAAPDANGHGVCEDLNSGGIGVDVLNGEPMTYAHIGGSYKEIFDPTPVVSGTWYDVITTWDGQHLDEYVNGKQVATMPASGALGLPTPDTAWHWTIGANAAANGGIEAPGRVSVASSKVWSTALAGGPSVPVTVPTTPDTSAVTPNVLDVDFADGTPADHAQHQAVSAPDTSAKPADILDVDFADGTPVDHAQNLPATKVGAPSIAQDSGLGANVATFNGTSDAYTYPFGDQWSKVAKSFSIECTFRWNGAAPDTAQHGLCEDLNGGGIGVDVLNGEPMTYAYIGGGYKEIFDPTPVVPGTWYDVITTWDGQHLDEYVNGTLVATQAASGALGLPSPSSAWNWTIGADSDVNGGIAAPARASVAVSKVWSTALPAGPKVAVPGSLPVTTYGAPAIAKDAGLGANVATFNGTGDAYTYPFGDQWSKIGDGFTVECRFRWNGAPPTGDHGVCSDTNSGGLGVHVLNGEPMTYAYIGGGYKEIFDPAPVVPGTWYDVVTTWDGSTLTEYVNGTQVATMAASGAMGLPQPNSTAYHWTLGADASAGGIEMQSPVTVASSKIWDTALPSAGTQTVYDTGKVTNSVKVGLSPASLTAHDGSVFVTNANSDTVSIIDDRSHRVTQTFNVEPLPGSTVGAAPNSVTFAGPNTLLVSVGSDNAIAQFRYNGPRYPVQYEGLIPTDWYPNQVTYDAAVGKVFVSNEYGIGTDGANQTHAMIGTLTTFTPPSNRTLGTLTGQVFVNNGWDTLPASNKAAPGSTSQGRSQGGSAGKQQAAPAAVPARLGEPSAIKHVFLIIKENRTYDQVLGDLGKGNGDPADTNYGATVTPNLHSLSNSFTDFDNFYDPAQQSADGHNWILQGDANDYLAQDQDTLFARSYPYPGGDALAYQRDGFLWDDVASVGGTVRNYGEFESIETGSQGSWQQYYADSQILEGKATGTLPVSTTAAQWASDVPALKAVSNPSYPHFDTSIPDQYRTDIWEQDFHQQVQSHSVPNLTVMTLGDDHTGGAPTAEAQEADNDLATGRIISDISHSSVWKNSAVFVEEDDTQAGVDHVDGHRGPLWIASPYAVRGAVNSDYYTQINVTKTIEQILGARPMNQMDRAAVPMFDAFTDEPDFTPYTVQPETVPLTEGVSNLIPLTPAPADSTATASTVTATDGPAAPTPPAAEQSVAQQWAAWLKTEAQPELTGPHARPDAVDPAQMNRYDWYSSTDWSKPYPGDKQILAPDQVPGRNLPGDLAGD